MSNLEAKYTLFDSLNQMLAPETLSELISRVVTHVDIQPMEHSGVSGSRLSRVDTNVGQLILKHVSITFDWAMFTSHDHHCRSVTLWRYGLLDRLKPHVDHKIITAAHEGNTWIIMMEHLGDSLFTEEKNPFSSEFILPLLDALASVHAKFWNNSDLTDAQLGLCSPTEFFYSFSIRSGQRDSGQAQSIVPGLIAPGWEVMEDLLDAGVFRQMLSLAENGDPILKAIERYPFTLLHGDFRPANLAYMDCFIFLDWQMATYSLMTQDLAWLTRDIRDLMTRERVNQIYRQRLEFHLNQHFDDTEWQAMVKLGYATDALRSTFLLGAGYKYAENSDIQEITKSRIIERGQMVMNALHLL